MGSYSFFEKDAYGAIVNLLHPCGRCRECMRQINEKNLEIDVILGKDTIMKLKDLLPYKDNMSKAE